MRDFTPEAYAAAIPACCERQTIEEHACMLLCWGLVNAVRAGRDMDCSGCDLATRPVFRRSPKNGN
jgi:hypothetical protein